MDEVIFYSDPQCVISSARVEIDGQTVALRNVTAVREEDRGTPVGGILLGMLGASAMSSAPVLGACLLTAAAYLVWRRITQARIVVQLSSGSALTIDISDTRRAQSIRKALSSAIAAR